MSRGRSHGGEETQAVRRRPSDRREIIVATARGLFARDGYERVTMAQIASEVGITPGALYRHFSSKADIFEAGLTWTIGQSLPTDDSSLVLEEFFRERAELAIAAPDLDLLWAMRGDALGQTQRRSLLAEMLTINDAYRRRIGLARPDLDHFDLTLLGWVIQSVLYSAHPPVTGLPEEAHLELVTELCSKLVRTTLPARRADSRPTQTIDLLPHARREALIILAGRLFGMHGYQSTSLADIGTAAGTSGPTLYGHFASKEDLLFALLERLNHHLWYDLGEALNMSHNVTEALRRTVATYVEVVKTRPQIVSLLVTRQKGAEATTRSQREYISEWVRLLMLARPQVPKPNARALVQATFRAINNLTWTSPDVRDNDFVDRVTHISMRILFEAETP